MKEIYEGKNAPAISGVRVNTFIEAYSRLKKQCLCKNISVLDKLDLQEAIGKYMGGIERHWDNILPSDLDEYPCILYRNRREFVLHDNFRKLFLNIQFD